MGKNFFHIPVMVEEAVDFLNPKSGGVYVDGTVGGGGHTQALLGKSSRRSTEVGIPTSAQSGSSGQITIVAIDQDEEAIRAAKKRLSRHAEFISASVEIPKSVEARSGSARQVRDDIKPYVIFIHNNFRNLNTILDNLNIKKVNGILLDLGVSSHQLDESSRGFSFRSVCHPELDSGSAKIPDQSLPRTRYGVRNDNSLDMRMDQGQKLTASEIVNNYSEEELRRIFFEFGEEKFSRQIAKEIVKRRREKKIKTPNDLVEIIKSATPPKYRFSSHRHFATKIFQALRIEANDELGALKEVLPQAVSRLKKNGRLVIISFHSLEDRIVKHFFREMKQEEKIEILTKKPIIPTQEEITLNPRAGSAKMRVAEKC